MELSSFERIPYVECMRRFGSDKPDLRFGMELCQLNDVFEATAFTIFQNVIEQGGDCLLYTSGGSSIIIDCLTDNPNRTIANLRACFNKAHAKLGVGGSVSFNYEHTGLIVIDYDDEEAMMDALIMAEVDLRDIEVEDLSLIHIWSSRIPLS